jgi:hypothetical protein
MDPSITRPLGALVLVVALASISATPSTRGVTLLAAWITAEPPSDARARSARPLGQSAPTRTR